MQLLNDELPRHPPLLPKPLCVPFALRVIGGYRLWKTATPAAIMQILGHSRVSTTLKYGQPTDDDLRAALEEASRIR